MLGAPSQLLEDREFAANDGVKMLEAMGNLIRNTLY